MSRFWANVKSWWRGFKSLLNALILVFGIPFGVIGTLIYGNVYRVLPVCDCAPLAGDKFWYFGYIIVSIIVWQLILLKTDNKFHLSLIVGLISVYANALYKQLFGNPHEVDYFDIGFYVLITFGICVQAKLKWYYLLLVVGMVVGLGMV